MAYYGGYYGDPYSQFVPIFNVHQAYVFVPCGTSFQQVPRFPNPNQPPPNGFPPMYFPKVFYCYPADILGMQYPFQVPNAFVYQQFPNHFYPSQGANQFYYAPGANQFYQQAPPRRHNRRGHHNAGQHQFREDRRQENSHQANNPEGGAQQ